MKRLGLLVAALCTLGCEREPAPPAAIPPVAVPETSARLSPVIARPTLDAAQMLDAINRVGVDSIVARMDSEAGLTNRVMKGIESGDSTWLEVAAALRPTGSVELGESLRISVAEALPRAPERVLSLVGRRHFTVDEVCDIPFFEPPDSLVAAYYADAVKALASVHDESFVADRDRCRAVLDRVRRL